MITLCFTVLPGTGVLPHNKTVCMLFHLRSLCQLTSLIREDLRDFLTAKSSVELYYHSKISSSFFVALSFCSCCCFPTNLRKIFHKTGCFPVKVVIFNRLSSSGLDVKFEKVHRLQLSLRDFCLPPFCLVESTESATQALKQVFRFFDQCYMKTRRTRCYSTSTPTQHC